MNRSDFEESVKAGGHELLTFRGVDVFVPRYVIDKILPDTSIINFKNLLSAIKMVYGSYYYNTYGTFIVILDPTQVFLYDIDKQNKVVI